MNAFLIISLFFSFPYFTRKENIRCYDCHHSVDLLNEKGIEYMKNYEFPERRNLLILSKDLDIEKNIPLSLFLYFDNNEKYFADVIFSGQASANRKVYADINAGEKIFLKEFFFSYERFKMKFFAGKTNIFFESPLKFIIKDSLYSYFPVPDTIFENYPFIFGIEKYYNFGNFKIKPLIAFSFPSTRKNMFESYYLNAGFYSEPLSFELFLKMKKYGFRSSGLLYQILKRPFILRGIFVYIERDIYVNLETGFMTFFRNPFSLFAYFITEYNKDFYPGFKIDFYIQENISFGFEYKFIEKNLLDKNNPLKFSLSAHL